MKRHEMKTIAILLTAITAAVIPCHAQDMPSSQQLIETVARVQQLLSLKDYSVAARTLFALTDTNEISIAARQLQRPRSRLMYEQLFEDLRLRTPYRSAEFPSNAAFKVERTILLGTNKWDRIERMEVMFWFNGNAWVFYGPSVDKALGRKIAVGIK
jgi:hypothetical protein